MFSGCLQGRRHRTMEVFSMEYVMVIDVGTTGCKATVFDRSGAVCAQTYEEYPVEGYTGMISPNLVWDSVCRVIRGCTTVHPSIAAICVTSFGESVVGVNHKGQVLMDSFLYTNDSAANQWQILDSRLGSDRIYALTGYISHSMYTASRLMWIRANEPEQYHAARYFLFFSSFIAWRLCGTAVAEDTQAARSMLYDLYTGDWSEEILSAAELDREKLPPVVQAGDILGTTTPEVNRMLGLAGPAQVVAGGQDQPCVALGLGAVRGGSAALGLGTVECLNLVLDRPVQNPGLRSHNFVCSPHVVPGKFVTFAVLYSGGVTLRDLRSRFYSSEHRQAMEVGGDVYVQMMDEAAAQETSVLMVPHFVGSGTPELCTADGGVLHGLRLETTLGQLVRSDLEGLAFDLRRNLDALEACGLTVGQIVAAGGGAKSRKGLEIRSSALGRPLELPRDIQAGTRGVYLIAAKALGWITDPEAAARFPTETVTSSADLAAMAEKYHRFCRLYTLVHSLDQES